MKESMSKLRRHSKKIIAVIIVVIVIAAGGVYFAKGDNVSYIEFNAFRGDVVTFYNYTGNIESNDIQTVLSTSNQPIKKLYVSEGDIVSKGDLLVEFKNDNLEASLAQARASLEIARVNYEKAVGTARTERRVQTEKALAGAEISLKKAETNLNRVQQLFAHEASSQTELDEAQDAYYTALINYNAAQIDLDLLETNSSQDARTALAQLEQAEASLANYETQLADSKIYAEINGKVTEIHVSENRQIAMGTRIMDIIDYNSLKVDIKVDEYALPVVKVGSMVNVYFNAINLRVRGTLSKISEIATVENGVSYFPATITLEKNENLRVGMSVEVNLVKDQAVNVIALPVRAVGIASDGSAYVEVKDEAGKIMNRPVMVGINDGMMAEIREGLEEGETIYFKSDSISALSITGPPGARGSGGNVQVMPGPGGGGVRIQQRN